jgi:hypothetical protein
MSLVRINRHPSRRQLTVFAVAWLVAGAFAGVGLWRRGHETPAIVTVALAVSAPLIGIGAPAALRWLYVGLSYATYPIGFVVSHVVLAIVYFGVVTPIGLVMRLCGYDPLERKFDAKLTSYWKLRRDRPPSESYFRQY